MKSLMYLTPGPTQLNDIAKRAYIDALNSDIGAMSHRGERFQKLNLETQSAMRALMQIPEEYQIFWLSSGTEAWERIIQNGVAKHSHHFVNGAFSKRFFQVSEELLRVATITESPWFKSFNFTELSILPETELIALTHNETSTGIMLQRSDIEKISHRYPEKLIALDVVSSAPYADIPWAACDYVFFSVQKFFGLPAGLGALIVSPRALEKARSVQAALKTTGSYHSFCSLEGFATKNETPATPNVIAIYALGEVCQAMLSVGIAAIRKETERKADGLYAFFESSSLGMPAVVEKANRSPTVLCIETKEQTKNIKDILRKNGIIVGSGYGAFAESHIRIANFWGTDALCVAEKLKI